MQNVKEKELENLVMKKLHSSNKRKEERTNYNVLAKPKIKLQRDAKREGKGT